MTHPRITSLNVTQLCLFPEKYISEFNVSSGLIGMLLTCFLTGNGTEMFISLVISVYPGYKSIKVRVIIIITVQ